MLDFSRTDLQLSLDLLQYKNKFHQLAESPLISATSDRDLLDKKTIAFVRKLNIDALKGGLYLAEENQFSFYALKNAILSEFFLLADKVLLSGELSFQGLRILQALKRYLFCHQTSWFDSVIHYSDSSLPFSFRGEILIHLLNKEEQNLFLALTDNTSIIANKMYFALYRKSLVEAAHIAGMIYKQAQVVEVSIQQKLLSRVNSNRLDLDLSSESCLTRETGLSREPDLLLNAQLLSAYVVALIWYDAKQFYELSEKLFNNLYRSILLGDNVSFSVEQFTGIIYSLIDFLQVVFNLDKLKQIALVFNQFNFSKVNEMNSVDQKIKTQLSVIIQVLKHFKLLNSVEKCELVLHLLQNTEKQGTCQIVELNSSYLQCAEKQRYLIKYNANLKLFTVC